MAKARFLVASVLVLLAASATTASALSAIPAGVISTTSLGTIALSTSGGVVNPSGQCTLTFSGNANSSIVNVAGSTFASITGGSAFNCTAGSWVVLGGTSSLVLGSTVVLSALYADVNLSGLRIQYVIAGTTCLFSGTLPMRLALVPLTPPDYSTLLLTIVANSIPRTSGSALCPTTLRLAGTFGLSPLQTLR